MYKSSSALISFVVNPSTSTLPAVSDLRILLLTPGLDEGTSKARLFAVSNPTISNAFPVTK